MKLVLVFLILTQQEREASLIPEPAGLSLDRVMTSNTLLCSTSTLEGGCPGLLFWRICKIIVKKHGLNSVRKFSKSMQQLRCKRKWERAMRRELCPLWLEAYYQGTHDHFNNESYLIFSKLINCIFLFVVGTYKRKILEQKMLQQIVFPFNFSHQSLLFVSSTRNTS